VIAIALAGNRFITGLVLPWDGGPQIHVTVAAASRTERRSGWLPRLARPQAADLDELQAKCLGLGQHVVWLPALGR
jgi:hypothetical protein